MKHAEKLVEQLRKADAVEKTVHPLFARQLAQMPRDRTSLTRFEHDAVWNKDITVTGLVGAGLHAVARWLTDA
jgi:hypothetical protein